MIPREMNPDVETIPGDVDADNPITERKYDMIIMTIAIAIVFAYAMKGGM